MGKKDKKPKPFLFARFTNELGTYYSQVPGKLVDVVPWLATFLFKSDLHGLWSVTEVTTGLQVSFGRTRALALGRALEILTHFGEEYTKERLAALDLPR